MARGMRAYQHWGPELFAFGDARFSSPNMGPYYWYLWRPLGYLYWGSCGPYLAVFRVYERAVHWSWFLREVQRTKKLLLPWHLGRGIILTPLYVLINLLDSRVATNQNALYSTMQKTPGMITTRTGIASEGPGCPHSCGNLESGQGEDGDYSGPSQSPVGSLMRPLGPRSLLSGGGGRPNSSSEAGGCVCVIY